MADKFDLDKMRREIEEDSRHDTHGQDQPVPQEEIMNLLKSRRNKVRGRPKGNDSGAQDKDIS